MVVCSWYWLLLLCKAFHTLATSDLCVVSHNPAHSRQGHFNYPLEIYSPNIHNEPNVSCIADSHRRHASCPIRAIGCPLVVENFIDALSYSNKWSKHSSFCELKKAFDDERNHSRIIILGGSVTSGEDSFGCCNQTECWNVHCRRCSWTSHFHGWLKSTVRTNISLLNLAAPGTNSIFTADVIYTIMSDNNISSLTSRDLIMLDFSFNDNVLSVPVEDVRTKRGLEKLIRFIIGMAASASDVPHIVLLAMDTDFKRWGPPENSYQHAYRAIAEHYGLHLFSYADAILSPNSLTKQAVYHDHLTTVARRGIQHPPWHGQLIFADFIAGTLVRFLANCDDKNVVTPDSVRSKPYELPQPLTVLDDSAICKAGIPPLIKMDYDEIMSNSSVVQRDFTWKWRLDHKQRGGLMISLNDSLTLEHMNDAPVAFPLGIAVSQLKQEKFMLQLQYLRSYMNVGVVSIGVCGWYFKDLDSLWMDHKHYRHTLQDVYSVSFPLEACKIGKKAETDEVVVSIMYKVQRTPEQSRNITELMLKEPRGTQVFKINSVLVCQY